MSILPQLSFSGYTVECFIAFVSTDGNTKYIGSVDVVSA